MIIRGIESIGEQEGTPSAHEQHSREVNTSHTHGAFSGNMSERENGVSGTSQGATAPANTIVNNSTIDTSVSNSELFYKKRVIGGIESAFSPTKIAVIGVGGGGVNAVSSMVDLELDGIDLWAANTDAQTLSDCPVSNVILLGSKSCNGLGVGGDPQRGAEAVYEMQEDISGVLKNYDMIFLATGLGGGTGSGAIPVLAKIARDSGVLVVSIVTMPFLYEGQKRQSNAENSLEELEEFTDALIIVPNNSLITTSASRSDVFVEDSFHTANKILSDTVSSITNILTTRGRVNIDFADIKSCIQNSGLISVGIGESNIEESHGGNAHRATEIALTNKLLSEENAQVLSYADNIIVNVVLGKSCPMHDYAAITDMIISRTSVKPSNIKTGHRFESTWDHKVQVTIIAASSLKSHGKKIVNPNRSMSDARSMSVHDTSRHATVNHVPTSVAPAHDTVYSHAYTEEQAAHNNSPPYPYDREKRDISLQGMYETSDSDQKYIDSDVFRSLINQPMRDVNEILQEELDTMKKTTPVQQYSDIIP